MTFLCDRIFTLSLPFFLFFFLSLFNSSFIFGAAFEQDIFRSIDKGEMQSVAIYLTNNGNSNRVDAKRRSLLSRAAYRGHQGIVGALLHAGASVDLEDDNNITPLYQASSAGHPAIVRLFIPKSKDINHADSRGVTALHIASKKGQTAVVQELCQSPTIQLNKQTNEEKETALWLACCQGHLSTVEVLLQTGADVDQPDQHGVTPFSSLVTMDIKGLYVFF